MFDSMLKVTQDGELGLYKVSPANKLKPEKMFAVVFKLEEQAKGLLGFGSKGVLLKGGHLFDKVSLIKDTELNNRHVIDVYCETDTSSIFVSDWVDCPHNHGTGCALSSALAANLIYGKESGCSLEWAVEQARNWLNRCLRASQHMNLGKGPGPLNIVSVHNIDL